MAKILVAGGICAEGEDPGPSLPAGVGPAVIQSLYDPDNPTMPGI